MDSICWVGFLTHCAYFCLLIGMFRLFSFNVITDILGLGLATLAQGGTSYYCWMDWEGELWLPM